MALTKVTKGSTVKITADSFNAMVDAANANKIAEAAKTISSAPPAAPYTRSVFRVVNDTDDHLNQYSIVGLGEPQSAPDPEDASFLDTVVLRGVTPDVELHEGRFAVLLQSAGSTEVVPAVVEGNAMVLIDARGALSCRRAEIVDGVTGYLRMSDFGSVEVLWLGAESETAFFPGDEPEGGWPDLHWGLVRLGNPPAMFPIKMIKTGGTQGVSSPTGPGATWTYRVEDFYGHVLATDVDPTSPPHRADRQAWGAVNEAQFGFAAYLDGVFTILQTSEIWEIHPDSITFNTQFQNEHNNVYAAINAILVRLANAGIP